MTRTPAPLTFGSSTWPGLVKVAEEAGEVVQVIAKMLAVGADPSRRGTAAMRHRLLEEIADLNAAVTFALDHSDLDATERSFIAERTAAKREKYGRWHADRSPRPAMPVVRDAVDSDAAGPGSNHSAPYRCLPRPGESPSPIHLAAACSRRLATLAPAAGQ